MAILSNEKKDAMTEEIRSVVNRLSLENYVNMPDFIIAEMIVDNFDAFACAVKRNELWHMKKRDKKIELAP